MSFDFDLKESFSVQNAYLLAKSCRAAYLDEAGTDLTDLDLDSVAVFFAGDAHGFVATTKKFVLLSFRGTNNIHDWLTDGRTAQMEDPAYPGMVHQGFAIALEKTWAQIRNLLPQPGDNRLLWVTGHSLGGALATLAGCRLVNEGIPVLAVYTFGCPRLGNPEFYSGYRTVNYRFVNNNDIVPHVPLERILVPVTSPGPVGIHLRYYEYKHVGTLEYLDRFGHLGQGMSDWGAKKEFVMATLAETGQPQAAALNDHRIDNYIEAIKTNL